LTIYFFIFQVVILRDYAIIVVSNKRKVTTMFDDDEYGQYEDDYKTFEDNCAWEDMLSDMRDYDE